MAMVNSSLEEYYQLINFLIFDHGIMPSEIEMMLPFELELLTMLRRQELERRKANAT